MFNFLLHLVVYVVGGFILLCALGVLLYILDTLFAKPDSSTVRQVIVRAPKPKSPLSSNRQPQRYRAVERNPLAAAAALVLGLLLLLAFRALNLK
jgi:hypothetical protein